jgi:hypothetical protein
MSQKIRTEIGITRRGERWIIGDVKQDEKLPKIYDTKRRQSRGDKPSKMKERKDIVGTPETVVTACRQFFPSQSKYLFSPHHLHPNPLLDPRKLRQWSKPSKQFTTWSQ